MPGHAKISLGSESKGKVLVSVESEPDSSGMQGLGRIHTSQVSSRRCRESGNVNHHPLCSPQNIGYAPRVLSKPEFIKRLESETPLQSECLCPARVHMLKPRRDGVRTWGLRDVIVS